MEIKIKQYWINIKSSLWFLPTIMVFLSILLAFIFIELDHTISYSNFPIAWFIYDGQRAGAMSVLSTIASSMVTIAGVTFSITLVALTMASSQFGPRLLRNFIADKGNQFVIGTFIATFIYSLIILLTIRGSGDDEFIPKISVVFAFLLAVMSLGVIIYFIHHVTTSIQADYIIKSSYNDFKKVADACLTDAGKAETVSFADEVKKVKEKFVLVTEACFQSSGFIQSIDYESSKKWAVKQGVVVEWLVYPGFFGTVYEPYARVHHHSSLPDGAVEQLSDFFVLSYQRTPNQDILFSLKQIMEVGVRALSPGINDPNTATTCIQWLGAALSILAKKSLYAPIVKDREGEVRVLIKQITYQDIVDTCLDQLRLYGKNNRYVTIEILKTIKKPLCLTQNKELRDVLRAKAIAVFNDSSEQEASAESAEIKTLYREIMQLLQ